MKSSLALAVAAAAVDTSLATTCSRPVAAVAILAARFAAGLILLLVDGAAARCDAELDVDSAVFEEERVLVVVVVVVVVFFLFRKIIVVANFQLK